MHTGSTTSGRIADTALRFGHELRRWRAHAGLTQRELAGRVRYSRETVAAVEGGRRYPSQELARRCDEVLATDGVLGRLWPLVESAQVAADRRRGPRSTRPDPAGSTAGSPAAELADRVASIRPAIGAVAPEFIVRLRDLVNDLAPAPARGGWPAPTPVAERRYRRRRVVQMPVRNSCTAA
jgi:transcriptional regulator with XRE-family HTH domain